MQYKIPAEFHYPLHFPRSRYSAALEDMLLMFSSAIVSNRTMGEEEFVSSLNSTIRKFSGSHLGSKTIDNHRTEMTALFGLVYRVDDEVNASSRLATLHETQDTPRFFKSLARKFQFPAGLLKPKTNRDLVEASVSFKPANVILSVLMKGRELQGDAFGISSEECANFIFNDLRVTAMHQDESMILDRILSRRAAKLALNCKSDYIRYARDFLRFLAMANLGSFGDDGLFRINPREEEAINTIVNDWTFFRSYNDYPDEIRIADSYRRIDREWQEYYATDDTELEGVFATNPSALITPQTIIQPEVNIDLYVAGQSSASRGANLNKIGAEGERIVYLYEQSMVKRHQPRHIRIVKLVADQIGLGYDVQSVHLDDGTKKKYIEVKSTLKNHFSMQDLAFVVTGNEWNVARQQGDDYFFYRVIISRERVSIFAIRDPFGQAEAGFLDVVPMNYRVYPVEENGDFLDTSELESGV